MLHQFVMMIWKQHDPESNQHAPPIQYGGRSSDEAQLDSAIDQWCACACGCVCVCACVQETHMNTRPMLFWDIAEM